MYKILYNTSMEPFDLSTILSSRAKFQVLQVLSTVEEGTSLRNIERLTGLAIRSVQIAVKSLVEAGVLEKKQKGRRILIRMNSQHVFFEALRDVFSVLQKHRLQFMANQHSEKAKDVLAFSSDVD